MTATFSADKKIRIWSSETGDLLHSITPKAIVQPMWFSEEMDRLIISPNGSANAILWIPQIKLERSEVKRFVELMTGQEVDNTEGIAELDVVTFRNAPDLYMRAWRNSAAGR